MGLLTSVAGLAFSNPLVLFGGVAALSAAAFGAYTYVHHSGYVEGKDEIQAKWDSEAELRRIDASKRTATLASDIDKTRKQRDAQLQVTRDRLTIALNSLRDRTDTRLPDVTPEECKGGTGAGLSGPDGRFLEGEAARANELRTHLGACYQEVDDIYKALEPKP